MQIFQKQQSGFTYHCSFLWIYKKRKKSSSKYFFCFKWIWISIIYFRYINHVSMSFCPMLVLRLVSRLKKKLRKQFFQIVFESCVILLQFTVYCLWISVFFTNLNNVGIRWTLKSYDSFFIKGKKIQLRAIFQYESVDHEYV